MIFAATGGDHLRRDQHPSRIPDRDVIPHDLDHYDEP
jgi:hypothetical protein